MAANIGYRFNKQVFKNLNETEKFKKETDNLLKDFQIIPLDQACCQLLDIGQQLGGSTCVSTFELKTTWPGLLIGLGYGHSTGTSEQEFKNGFYFDYTTGLPVLPGSTVKGILRSFFPGRYKDENKRKMVSCRLISILNKLDIKPKEEGEWNEKRLSELESAIFEERAPGNSRPNVFLEAYPREAVNCKVMIGLQPEEKTGIFLGVDTITPHAHPLKDPVPLRILKIRPGVTIRFQFMLNDEGMTVASKEKLFRELFLRFGAGAKSNVGFGHFQREQEGVDNGHKRGYLLFKGIRQENAHNFSNVRSNNSSQEAEGIIRKKVVKKLKDNIPQGQIGVPVNSAAGNISKSKDSSSLKADIPEGDDWPEFNTVKKGDILKATVMKFQYGHCKVRYHIKGMKQYCDLPGIGAPGDIVSVKVSENPEGSIRNNNAKIKGKKVV